MEPSGTASSPIDISSFRYVVGIDIGSELCSFCVLKPDKSQVIKPTEMSNAASGFALLNEQLEQLGVASAQTLIGLEATSRYGENLYRFLESRGYQLCLLHPRQTHQFAR
jgi:transposase